MFIRVALARTTALVAVLALAACAGGPQQSAKVAAAAQQPVTIMVPHIATASEAVGEVADSLNVSLRGTVYTPTPKPELFGYASIQPRTVKPSRGIQCVPFARERSGVQIRGNANTWWRQAAGKFVRVSRPEVGAVAVMNTRRGHVAVVTKIVDDRTIIIDHANWFSNGRFYLDQPVIDVSENNDWSAVRVWNPNLGSYGGRVLRVPGFILNEPANGDKTVFASYEGPRVNTNMVAMTIVPGSGNTQLAALAEQDRVQPAAFEPEPGEIAQDDETAPAEEIVAAPVQVAEAAPQPETAPAPVQVAEAVVPMPEAPAVAADAVASIATPERRALPEPAAVEAPVQVAAFVTDRDARVPNLKPQAIAALATAPVQVAEAAPVQVADAAPAAVAFKTDAKAKVPNRKPPAIAERGRASEPAAMAAVAVPDARGDELLRTAMAAAEPSRKPSLRPATDAKGAAIVPTAKPQSIRVR
jgi:surface antigen